MDLMAKAFAILMILVVQTAWLIFRFRREKRKNLYMVVPPGGLLGRLAISLGCWIGGIGVLALGYYPLLLLWWAAQQTDGKTFDFSKTGWISEIARFVVIMAMLSMCKTIGANMIARGVRDGLFGPRQRGASDRVGR